MSGFIKNGDPKDSKILSVVKVGEEVVEENSKDIKKTKDKDKKSSN